MTMLCRDLPALPDTESLGRALARLLRVGDCVLLDGPLGAGKTALARALLREACRDPQMAVPSPSYTLVQSYEGMDCSGAPLSIAHYDLWRLDGAGALEELGWEEAREGVVVVEWPDRLGPFAPDGALHVVLSLLPTSDPDPDAPRPRRAVLSGWADRLSAVPATA